MAGHRFTTVARVYSSTLKISLKVQNNKDKQKHLVIVQCGPQERAWPALREWHAQLPKTPKEVSLENIS